MKISSTSLRYLILFLAVLGFSVSLIIGFSSLYNESRNEEGKSKELTFWSATQLDHEFWRFMDTLDRYRGTTPDVQHDDLLLRLDLLWSRIAIAKKGDVGQRLLLIEGNSETIARFEETLERIEPEILALKKGDEEAIEAVRAKLDAHTAEIYELSKRTSHFDQGQTFLFKQHTSRTYLLIFIMFLGLLATGSVLVVLLLRELRRSKRWLMAATEAENKAHESEQKFRDYAESSSDWFWETDTDGRVVALSDEFFASHDFVREDIIGKSFDELDQGYGNSQYQARPLGVSGYLPFRDLRCRWRSADGEIVDLNMSGMPLINDQRRLTGFRGTMSDVSKRVRLEAQLARTGKMESLGLLSGGVAHEFNNLLSLIGGYAGIIKRFPDEKARVAEAVETIISSAEQGTSLTRQMLAFARKSDLEVKTVPVSDAVRNIRAMVKPFTGEKIVVNFDFSDGEKFIHIDPNQLSQAVLNLAINARDAMSTGGELTIGSEFHDFAEATQIGAQTLAPGRYVAIFVEDTGAGIASEMQERIFEPFFTTKGENKGTGLGLSIIYGLMADSGGAIGVRSEVGHGSRFTLYLPEAAPAGGKAGLSEGAAAANGNVVLIAEPHDGIGLLLRATMEELGYRVLSAKDGEAAAAIYHDNAGEIALLLSATNLPGAEGGALAETLRADDARLKVVHLAQRGGEFDLPEKEGGGASRIVHKPFDLDILVETINDLMAA